MARYTRHQDGTDLSISADMSGLNPYIGINADFENSLHLGFRQNLWADNFRPSYNVASLGYTVNADPLKVGANLNLISGESMSPTSIYSPAGSISLTRFRQAELSFPVSMQASNKTTGGSASLGIVPTFAFGSSADSMIYGPEVTSSSGGSSYANMSGIFTMNAPVDSGNINAFLSTATGGQSVYDGFAGGLEGGLSFTSNEDSHGSVFNVGIRKAANDGNSFTALNASITLNLAGRPVELEKGFDGLTYQEKLAVIDKIVIDMKADPEIFFRYYAKNKFELSAIIPLMYDRHTEFMKVLLHKDENYRIFLELQQIARKDNGLSRRYAQINTIVDP